MAGLLLLIGLICNLLMRPVNQRYVHVEGHLPLPCDRRPAMTILEPKEKAIGLKLVVFWLLVGAPLLWGIVNTIGDATKLFR